MPGRERGEKSAFGSSKITLIVKNQDGDKVSVRLNRSSQVKKLVHSYCEREELDVNSVALVFDDCFLRWEQTPNELGLEDGDEICAFNADLLRSNVQEGTQAQSQEQKENDPRDEGLLDNHTFDELAERTTHRLEQKWHREVSPLATRSGFGPGFPFKSSLGFGNKVTAMSFLKASFRKANRLTEAARNSTEEIKIKNESLNEVLNVAEKKVAERDLLIEKLHRELQQANAEIRILYKEQSHRAEELVNVKQELNAKEEFFRKEVEDGINKPAAVAVSHSRNKLKRACLNEPICTKQYPVAQSRIVNEEDKTKFVDGSAGINIKVVGQETVMHAGKSVFFSVLRNTKLRKVMQAYCEREGKDLGSMCFIFNGCMIRMEQTPNELQMDDGDEIYAFDDVSTKISLPAMFWGDHT